MQVLGLPRHIIRAGAVASRIAAQPSHGEAAIRRDAVARWLELSRHGLTAKQAAKASSTAAPSCIGGWTRRAEQPPASRRPAKDLDPELVEAVERIRDDNPI